MIRIAQLKLRPEEDEAELYKKLCRKLKLRKEDILSWKIVKKSIDARKKEDIQIVFQVDVEIKKKESAIIDYLKNAQVQLIKEESYRFTEPGAEPLKNRPVIAGTGPAGLFCGYMLAKAGYCPILLERGGPVDERAETVTTFWKTGILDPECNVQFGEGGAGTFSDGKLNTLVKDPAHRGKKVLEIFARMGAGEEILYEQKPHIGTDVLKHVIKNLRREIEQAGGEFHFHSKVSGLDTDGGRLTGIHVSGTKKEEEKFFPADCLVLAIGHSARDTFKLLYEKRLDMKAKSFAVGLRVEHPQQMIQVSQYGETFAGLLAPAPYKLTARSKDGRGVYSFCMCPGGYVVNASSEPGMTAVNGMSNRSRDGRNANSAMIVTVSPEDFGNGHPLSGIAFQRELEKTAYELGGGRVPIQLYGDFKEDRMSRSLGDVLPDTMGGNHFANLRRLLPEYLNKALIEGIEQCGKKLRGFSRYDAVLSGVESRTSSPIRIERNDSMEANIPGIYPCGEGAGYAGGITSAAMDGMKVAEAIASRFSPRFLQSRKD
ncbi:FAD-dependent oxidoreductase [Lacrimispora sp. NSJ-141]|uniref:FAD-dependent oxidoreductase n=1 Tax=Lientehia hominis TaxID=2897778 RepID=A0AAP2RFH1_9FIRM|nr:FAD-dependent oxidoreductase [Lientehia hominis]MCD2491032.1 FAD-dependent oxidoreductase [Lientehia hominis]